MTDERRLVAVVHLPMAVREFVAICEGLTNAFPEAVLAYSDDASEVSFLAEADDSASWPKPTDFQTSKADDE